MCDVYRRARVCWTLQKESEGTCRGKNYERKFHRLTWSWWARRQTLRGDSPNLWAREVWVGKRRGCSRWEVLGSNNNSEDSEQTGKKKMGGWKERKGTTERDGPRERLPISGRTGSLVYISSFVSHPPPTPRLFEDLCACHGLWSLSQGIFLSICGVLMNVEWSVTFREALRCWRALKPLRPKGDSSLVKKSSTAHYEIDLISNAGRLLLLIFSHPYPLTAFGASSVCIPTWLCE